MKLRTYQMTETAWPVEMFLDRAADEPRFDMGQPYQRGIAWGVKRQRNLIKSLLRGLPIQAIIINDRMRAEFSHPGYSQDRCWQLAAVDGKQRITTLQGFIASAFGIPAEWIDDEGTGELRYSDLPAPLQRKILNTTLPVILGQLATLDEEQELFDLVNFGGLAQGETDDDLLPANPTSARQR